MFCGMLLGGIGVGRLTRSLGLGKVLAIGVSTFSLAMLGCAVSTTPWLLVVLRFIAGAGLGMVMPGCMALVRQGSTFKTSALAISVVMAGIPTGGIFASAAAYFFAADVGWRPFFVAGALLGIFMIPVTVLMTRTARSLRSAVTAAPAKKLPHEVLGPLVAGAAATFCFLLSFYGLIT